MSKRQIISACIFDLGGVILGSPLEGISEYEKRHNIPHNFVNICIVTKGLDSAFSKLERGKIELSDFYQEFHEQLADPSQVKRYVEFLRKKGRPIPNDLPTSVKIDTKALFALMMDKAAAVNRDMLHALVVLRGHGYKVAALTNNWQIDDDERKDSSSTTLLEPYFDLIIESSIVGLRKPDPKIYKLVCDKIGVKFEESVFLDDIGINVKAAKSLGMKTIKVDLGRNRDALDELKAILGDETLRLYPDDNVNIIPTTLSYSCGRNNGKLVVDVFGRMDNPPVLFFHGGGQTRHSWDVTAARFASAGFCAITVDMKGHGQSYWDTSQTEEYPYTIESFGSDMDSLLERLHMTNSHGIYRKPILVGASLGGLSILHSNLAKRSASAVVLVDIAPKMEKEGVGRITSWMTSTAETGFATMEEAAAAVQKYNPRAKSGDKDTEAKPFNLESLKKNLRKRDNGRFYWHWDPNFLAPYLENEGYVADLKEHERKTNEMAKEIECPCLLVRGSKTDVLSQEGVQSFKSFVPHAEVVDVAEAGHMVAGDQNTIFAAAVLDFAKRQVLADTSQESKL